MSKPVPCPHGQKKKRGTPRGSTPGVCRHCGAPDEPVVAVEAPPVPAPVVAPSPDPEPVPVEVAEPVAPPVVADPLPETWLDDPAPLPAVVPDVAQEPDPPKRRQRAAEVERSPVGTALRLERAMPGAAESDLEVERTVLAAFLNGKGDVRLHRLSSDDFYGPGHIAITSALLAVVERGGKPDSALVAAELEARGVLAHAGGAGYLVELEGSKTLPADLGVSLGRLRELAGRRQALRDVDLLATRLYDPSTPYVDVIDSMRSVVSKAAAAGSGGLPVVTRLLSDVKAEPINWLWEDTVPLGGLTLLLGPPKVGKSTATRGLAASVTTGAGLPLVRDGGRLGPKRPPAGVVIAAGEDPAAQVLQPSLKAAGADLSRVAVLDGRGDPDLPAPWRLDDLDALDQAVDRVGAALVVIDPWQMFCPPGVDLHRQDDVRGLLSPLHRWAVRRGLAVVLVAHPNKGASGEVHQRVNGSMDTVAIARSVLVCARKDGQSVLAQKGSNWAAPDLPGLVYTVKEQKKNGIQAAWAEWAGTVDASDLLAPAPSAEDRDAQAEALEVLNAALEEGPRKAEDVIRQCKRAGLTDRDIKAARKSLKVGFKPVKVKGGKRGDGFSVLFLPEHQDLVRSMYQLNELNELNEAPALTVLAGRSTGTDDLYGLNELNEREDH